MDINAYMTWVIHLLVILLFFLFGCERSQTVKVDTGNEILDALLQDVDHSVINLDQVELDTLVAEKENILGYRDSDNDRLPEFLGTIADLLILDETILVADRQQNLIWEMDLQGFWKQVQGNEGEGPGEFRNLFKILSNSTRVYAIDRSNAKIQVYDHQLTNKGMFSQAVFGISDEQFSVSDDYIFYPSDPFSDSLLVKVRSANMPWKEEDSFLPALIPAGQQPAAYNTFHSHSNSRGNFVATYAGTPYLFIFNDDFKLEHYIRFESSFYTELENPSLNPVSSSQLMQAGEPPVPGVKSFIYNLKVSENETIYFLVDSTLFRLTRGSRGGYDIQRGWVMKDGARDEDKLDGEVIQIGKFDVKNDMMILSTFGSQEILRFNLK